MKKRPPELEGALPTPKDITAVAQNIDSSNINKIALRRGKVRELVRMGYEPHQIVLILDKGIKLADKTLIKVPISNAIVKSDIIYIRQEDASKDVDFIEKRAEILDKLSFLYNRAVSEFIGGKGAVKNSFLNTALAVLGKIVEIEGIKSPEEIKFDLSAEAKVAKFATTVHELDENDREAIIGSIRKVLEKRQPEGVGGVRIPSKQPRVPVLSSDNAGVSGKS